MDRDRELDWIEQCFMSLPTQYSLYGRRFLQVKKPNQQYQVIKEKRYKGKPRKCKQQNTHKYDQYMLKRYNTYNTQQVYTSTMG